MLLSSVVVVCMLCNDCSCCGDDCLCVVCSSSMSISIA